MLQALNHAKTSLLSLFRPNDSYIVTRTDDRTKDKEVVQYTTVDEAVKAHLQLMETVFHGWQQHFVESPLEVTVRLVHKQTPESTTVLFPAPAIYLAKQRVAS